MRERERPNYINNNNRPPARTYTVLFHMRNKHFSGLGHKYTVSQLVPTIYSKGTTKTPKHRPLEKHQTLQPLINHSCPLLPTIFTNEIVVSHLESERSPSSQEALAVRPAALAGEDKAEKSLVFATSRGKQPG